MIKTIILKSVYANHKIDNYLRFKKTIDLIKFGSKSCLTFLFFVW